MNKHNLKHLTISDRLYIEQELLQGTSFKAIAKVLHKDPTIISKEVKRARKYLQVVVQNHLLQHLYYMTTIC